MAEDAKKELDEAVEAVEELIEDNKMPNWRWVLKLIVEKLLAPVLIAAVTSALTAILGWYAIGQHQVKTEAEKVGIEAGARSAEAEAARLEEARVLVAEWEAREAEARVTVPMMPDEPKPLTEAETEALLEEMRKKWKERHPELPRDIFVPLSGTPPAETDVAIDRMTQMIQQARGEFPEDYMRAKLANIKK